MSGIEISVVVCTYNRAGLLAGILEGLCNQQLAPTKFEVIIVDNNSTDDTRLVVESYEARFPTVRYSFEKLQGLSHARNRGWQEARGDYVAYVDDDCRVPPEWLTVAAEIMALRMPQLFGGPYFPFYMTTRPSWFKDVYGSNFQGNEPRILRSDEYLSGGNLFIQRQLLEKLGGFKPELGMSGRKVAYGEETIFIRQACKTTPEISVYYEPHLYVYHLVSAEKMRLSKVLFRRFAEGRYSYLAFNDGAHPFSSKHALGLVGLPFLLVVEAGPGMLFRNRKKYPYYQNYLFEHVFYRVIMLGRLYERLKETLRFR